MSTDEWINKAAEQNEAERAAALANKGMKPFYVIDEGVHELDVDRNTPPREVAGKYGPVRVLSLNSPAEKELGLSAYAFSVIIEQLDKQAHGRIKLMRTGTGPATIYKCLPIK
jgi:hypothetical protein